MPIIANSYFSGAGRQVVRKRIKKVFQEMKKETYVCSKCHRTVELVYLPDILPETKELFDTLFKTKLCSKCCRIN